MSWCLNTNTGSTSFIKIHPVSLNPTKFWYLLVNFLQISMNGCTIHLSTSRKKKFWATKLILDPSQRTQLLHLISMTDGSHKWSVPWIGVLSQFVMHHYWFQNTFDLHKFITHLTLSAKYFKLFMKSCLDKIIWSYDLRMTTTTEDNL